MSKYFAIKKVKPIADYKLILVFSNGEKRVFDMKPYLNKGIFKQLRDVSLFNTAHVSFDTVEWDNEADFDPEVLYSQSKKIAARSMGTGGSSISRSPLSTAAEPKQKYRKK